MHPLNEYLLVKKAAVAETGGLTYAQAVDDFIYKGEVVLVADDVESKHPGLVGKVVYFQKHSGEEVEKDGEKMKFVNVMDLIAYE